MVHAIVFADAVPPVAESFGRVHPLAVHLPLGLVIAAFLVEGIRSLRRLPTVSAFTPVAIGLGALGAVAASATGWFFAMSEGSGGTLFWHRWLGIAASVGLVALAWVARRAADPVTGEQVTRTLRVGLVASTVLVAWVGHLGGDMVWGPNFAFEPLLRERAGAPADGAAASRGADAAATGTGTRGPASGGAASATTAVAADDHRLAFYNERVLPLLQERCYECHGNGKHKGGLALDSRAKTVTRDGRGDWIVKEGDAAHSLLIERCMLPATDDDAMPPEGDRLSETQLAVLRTWIDDGAAMPADGAASGGGTRSPGAGPGAAGGDAGAGDAAAGNGLPPLTDAEIAEAAALREKGINAVPIANGASMLSVSLPGGKAVDDTAIASLVPIAGRIGELSLARASISDAGVMGFPMMPGVRMVRLDGTPLTDIGIVAVLSRTLDAEVVNLVGTGATDGSFVMLAKLPNLRRVYVHDTAITSQGIDRFRATHPRVEIVVGQAMPGTSTAEGPPLGP